METQEKEKAEELVRHFKGRGMDGDEDYASKECALIVVNEILLFLSLQIGFYDENAVNYWNEVEQEINNL